MWYHAFLSQRKTEYYNWYKTIKGLFELKVIYFGLCNSPGTFQWMMTSIFWELLYKGTLVNYMDDFVIPAKTEKELEEYTIRFLEIAEKHNLCFKWLKCNFNITEMPILGVWVGNGEVQMKNEKMEDTNKSKECQKLLRLYKLLSTIYQRFQPHHNTIKLTKRQRRMEMERRRTKCIWRIKTKDNDTFSTSPI